MTTDSPELDDQVEDRRLPAQPRPTPRSDVRVRFCPSPTGTPHVGLARTCLFNWAFARHTGGTLVFRVEDTDAQRDSEDSYLALLEMMTWLGFDYDEGPGVGGPYPPYRQSQRKADHLDVARLLVANGFAYPSYSTPEEVEARHRAAGRDPKEGYDNHDRDLSEAEREAFEREGRTATIRFRMPDEDITFTDYVRGEVTFKAGTIPDYAIVRGNGEPLYTLVNPVDDARMGITHILRGEDLLASTPRQIALFRALIELGIARHVPRYGHLPLVTGDGNRKLSKRDPESNLFLHRDRGFIREGMVNYLGTLGWSIAEDRDVFEPHEMVAAFEPGDVQPSPARWDQKKADAINADHIRRLDPDDLASRLLPYLERAGVLGGNPSLGELGRLQSLIPLLQPRLVVLTDAIPLVAPFYVTGDEVVIEDEARAQLPDNAIEVLDAAVAALEKVPAGAGDLFGVGATWTSATIETALRSALLDGLGLKAKVAFAPVRVAVAGKRVSLPLFESMEILGKHSTMRRLARLRDALDPALGPALEPAPEND